MQNIVCLSHDIKEYTFCTQLVSLKRQQTSSSTAIKKIMITIQLNTNKHNNRETCKIIQQYLKLFLYGLAVHDFLKIPKQGGGGLLAFYNKSLVCIQVGQKENERTYKKIKKNEKKEKQCHIYSENTIKIHDELWNINQEI